MSAAYLGAAALPGLAGVLARRAGLEVIGPVLVAGALVLLVLHEVILRRASSAPAVPPVGVATAEAG